MYILDKITFITLEEFIIEILKKFCYNDWAVKVSKLGGSYYGKFITTQRV